VQLTLTLKNYVQGALIQGTFDGMTDSMRCGNTTEPEHIPGYVEYSNEVWVLAGTAERPSWITNQPATYNPVTGAIKLEVKELPKTIPGQPNRSEVWEDTFTGTYRSGRPNLVEGTLVEVNRLKWTHSDAVSTCTATYSVKATLR